MRLSMSRRILANVWRAIGGIAAAAMLGYSGSALAAELAEGWTTVRALGMGNAFTSVATEGDAMFYNPAALARVSGFEWTIVDPRLGVNGPQALEVARVAQSNSELADKINDLYGKAVWLGGGGKSSIVIPYFGVAGFANTEVGMNLQNPANPQMNLNYFFDYGVAMSAAVDLLPGIWSVGLTGRRVNRTGTNIPIGAATIATLDLNQITNRLKDRGTGYGMDFGTLITIPSPVRPAVAFTIRNLGYTAFSFEEGTQAPPRIEPEMTIGGSLTVDTLLLTITPSFDYRYLDRADIQTGKKLHMGVEFDLPLLSVRAGLYQGYYSLGVGLDAGVLAIDAATYGVELGEYPGQLEDRRYIVQLTLQLGLDGSDLSFLRGGGGSSGSGGGKRRLKQRR